MRVTRQRNRSRSEEATTGGHGPTRAARREWRTPLTPRAALVARLRAAGCVFAEEEALLLEAATGPEPLEAMVSRRTAGEPLEYILGWVEFCGRRLTVRPGVFVPRRRTEFLVSHAIALTLPGDVVLDLCCGCGAIGVAIGHAVDAVELHAADLGPAAVQCARDNTAVLDAHVYQGDLFDPLPSSLRGRVNILAANVPYVPTDAIAEMPPEARDHEPHVTLDGGADGLDVVRRVARHASEWLAAAGHVLIETSERQAPIAAAIYADAGLSPLIAHSDDLSATIVIGAA